MRIVHLVKLIYEWFLRQAADLNFGNSSVHDVVSRFKVHSEHYGSSKDAARPYRVRNARSSGTSIMAPIKPVQPPVTRSLESGVTFWTAAQINVVLVQVGGDANGRFNEYSPLLCQFRQLQLRTFCPASSCSPIDMLTRAPRSPVLQEMYNRSTGPRRRAPSSFTPGALGR